MLYSVYVILQQWKIAQRKPTEGTIRWATPHPCSAWCLLGTLTLSVGILLTVYFLFLFTQNRRIIFGDGNPLVASLCLLEEQGTPPHSPGWISPRRHATSLGSPLSHRGQWGYVSSASKFRGVTRCVCVSFILHLWDPGCSLTVHSLVTPPQWVARPCCAGDHRRRRKEQEAAGIPSDRSQILPAFSDLHLPTTQPPF